MRTQRFITAKNIFIFSFDLLCSFYIFFFIIDRPLYVSMLTTAISLLYSFAVVKYGCICSCIYNWAYCITIYVFNEFFFIFVNVRNWLKNTTIHTRLKYTIHIQICNCVLNMKQNKYAVDHSEYVIVHTCSCCCYYCYYSVFVFVLLLSLLMLLLLDLVLVLCLFLFFIFFSFIFFIFVLHECFTLFCFDTLFFGSSVVFLVSIYFRAFCTRVFYNFYSGFSLESLSMSLSLSFTCFSFFFFIESRFLFVK